MSGGENVRPQRVEDALRHDRGVADVAVAGVEDREWGQAVVAYVVPAPGEAVDGERLRALARERLQPYEVPKRFVAVDELPRTASGKLLRRMLAERPVASRADEEPTSNRRPEGP